jgi:hypothetical protein
VQKANVTHVPEAIGQDRLEEPAETLHAVEVGGAEAGPAQLTIGAGADAGVARDKTTVGDGDPADLGGEVLGGRVAVWLRLPVDVPGGVPDLWVDVLQPSSCGDRLCVHGVVDGCEGRHRDTAVGPGGAPRVTGFGETATWDEGRNRRVILELAAPGMQDPGTPRESGPNAPLVLGEPLQGLGRGFDQGLGRAAWTRGGRDAASQARCRCGGKAARAAVAPEGGRAPAGLYAAGPGDSGGCHKHAGRGVALHSWGTHRGCGHSVRFGTVGWR